MDTYYFLFSFTYSDKRNAPLHDTIDIRFGKQGC